MKKLALVLAIAIIGFGSLAYARLGFRGSGGPVSISPPPPGQVTYQGVTVTYQGAAVTWP